MNKRAAAEYLRTLIEEAKTGSAATIQSRERVAYEDLRKVYLDFYEAQGRKSLKVRKENGSVGGKEGEVFVCGLNHLDNFFRDRTAILISNADVAAFVAGLRKQELSNATINRSVAALRKMFNLARDKKMILPTDGPNMKVEFLPEPEPRKGFIRHKEFLRLKEVLLPHIRAVAIAAYNTGMRKGELLNLKWRYVDLADGFIKLRPEQTKNKKGRLIPLDAETLRLLKGLDQFRSDDGYVFQGRKKEGKEWVRNGRKIADSVFNKVWNNACVRAKIIQSTEDGDVVSHLESGKYVGAIPHDLRRSYVRSMDNSGVPASLGQKITGHLDAAVYESYSKTHRDDLLAAAEKRVEWLRVAG